MTKRMRATALLAGLLMPLAACGGDEGGDDGEAAPSSPRPPVTSSVPAPAAPTPAPAPAPAPTLLPALPDDRLESDPAVQGLRDYLVRFARAVNARAPEAPSLLAAVTAKQRAQVRGAYDDDAGTHYPGPSPLGPVSVTAVSATEKRVRACILDEGWNLTREGGRPTDARRQVFPSLITMRLEGGTWKLDGFLDDERLACDGVRLVEQRFTDTRGTDGSAQPGAGS